ncbi:carboxylate--amine ligase [Photorhabdus temperata]|uniref:ATP-grasp domain-containing protein n=1 Tax=Photorhabdus khanii TaxID=1004150 RepID=A0A7C9GKN3_9GAMM|nr:ATP-grasp domain-containing protein [Photorhabdus khanii]MQL46839.1 ATP-grasp domain-containing protein [Photorhabdus khanii]OHV59073.1 carboxylate--amine ligase [Photorhabdus temperata]
MGVFIFLEVRPTECLAIDYIRYLGFSPVLLTSMASMNKGLYDDLKKELFDNIYYIDTRSSTDIINLIKDNHIPVAAILGCYDDMMIPASEVALEFGLPHPDLKGLRNAFSKKNVRDILVQYGYYQPAYEVFSYNNIPENPKVPFPFVIKPLRDAGAYGVSLCKSKDDYRNVISDISSSGTMSMLGKVNEEFLIEEFLQGNFYGAELIYNHDKWHLIGINRIFVSPDDGLCMIGLSHPADDLSEVEFAIACELVKGWVTALGLRGGAINVEFIYTSHGPALVEINLRIAGARAAQQIFMSTGVNMVKYLVDFVCGIESTISPELVMTYPFVADAFIFHRGEAIVNDISVDSDSPYFISAGFKKTPFSISSKNKNFGSIVGYALAHGDSCTEAMENAMRIANSVQLKTN